MRKPRILVLGGTHGNEKLGVQLVKLLKNKPISGVESVIANPKAVRSKKRFVESDLNRSFGLDYPGTYETKRAAYLKKVSKQFDIVLDFHNTQTPDNNCTFVGMGCNSTLFEVAKQLNFKRCVEATYDCINKYCLNTISIEISVQDQLDSAKYWYNQIEKLSKLKFDIMSKNALEIYRFKRRVTWEEKSAYSITGWVPFRRISTSDKNNLGLSGIIVPIFVGSKLTEFYATLLSKERDE